MKKYKQPYEKYGVSESSSLMAYSSGYNSAHSAPKTNPFKIGTALNKIWAKGKREAKKI